jgi:hemolysin-activating ACP:hemolysin acyltransferase
MSTTSAVSNSAPKQNGTPPPPTDAVKTAAARGTSSPGRRGCGRAQRTATLRNALAFTQALGVLMRSPHYRTYTLADIEWLVIPPLMAGQFRIGEARPDRKGPALPVAAVLWASISPEVDKRLAEAKSAAPRLKQEDWKSGDILWLAQPSRGSRSPLPWSATSTRGSAPRDGAISSEPPPAAPSEDPSLQVMLAGAWHL